MNQKSTAELYKEIAGLKRKNEDITRKLLSLDQKMKLYKKQYQEKIKENSNLAKELKKSLDAISNLKKTKTVNSNSYKKTRKKTVTGQRE